MGRIGNVVFDAPGTTLEQYARSAGSIALDLMSMPERIVDTPDRVEIARADGDKPNLAFQHSASPLPRWPDPASPQQVHLDLDFDDEADGQARAMALGAIALPFTGGGNVYADPAGHPFCVGDGCGPPTRHGTERSLEGFQPALRRRGIAYKNSLLTSERRKEPTVAAS